MNLSRPQLDSLLADAVREYQRRERVSKPTKDAPVGLTAWKERFIKSYVHSAFMAAIDLHLEAIARYVLTGGKEGLSRLMVFCPPRHGKSLTISRAFPAWLYSKMPDLRVIASSYGANLAAANSGAVRNFLASPAYSDSYPNVRLANTRLAHWRTSAGGEFVAAGVKGPITGHGAQLLLLDDPTKSRSDAESPTFRAALQEWFSSDLLSRLEEPGGAIVLVATRWHTDDLPGWLLSGEDAADWRVLCFPALAEPGDPLNREVGEALWPEKYSETLLADRRELMGPYAWASLYQQQPIARGAGLFDTAKIAILDSSPVCTRAVRFYDLAVSSKSTADYSVGCLLGVTADADYIVQDVIRWQASPATTGDSIINTALRDGPTIPIWLEAENSARVQLDYLLRDSRLAGYTIRLVSPSGDKYTRAAPVAARAAAGKLKIVRAAWNRAFLDECAVFNLGRHDDQVDALSGGFERLATARPITANVRGYFNETREQVEARKFS